MNNQRTKQNLVTAAKEFGRLFVATVPGFVAATAVNAWTNDPTFSTGIGAIIFGLVKSYDKSIHDDPTTSRTGVIPF